MSYRCALHPDTPITHFCQTCKDLTCQKCITKQPHSGSAHIIKSVNDSANVRRNLYADYIENEINPIRSQAQKKLSYIQLLKKQAERDRKVIQKDIKIQFEAINSRMEDKQSVAIIAKQTEMKHLQNFVHTFDDITETFDSIYENPQALLISYKTLDGEIKKMESIKQSIEQSQSKQSGVGLERQFQSTLHKTQSLPQYQARNEFVNKLINGYVTHIKKKIKQTKQNCQKQGKLYEHTFNNVFKQVVSDQSAKVCAFCGFPFTIDYANQQCANNRTYKMSCIYPDVDWQSIIPQSERGTKRHFWYKSLSIHRKRPKMQQHSLVRRSTKKHYFNSLLQLQIVKNILKEYQIEKGKKFSNVISDNSNDPKNTGYISKIAFIYTMSKIYNVSKEQIQSMIDLLQEEQGINYRRLEELLDNPTEDYFKFSIAQEEAERAKPIAPQTISRFKY